MEKALHWINKKLTPALTKVTQNPIISAILGGYGKNMGIILVGSILQIISNVAAVILMDETNIFSLMSNLTLGIVALFSAYSVASTVAEKGKAPVISTGFFSVCVFLIMQHPTFTEEGLFQIDANRIGGMGMFTALITGLVTGAIFNLFHKNKWTIHSKALPDFVEEWFISIIPGIVVVALAWVISYVLNFDLHQTVTSILIPLVSASDSYIAWVGTAVILTVLFAVGINGAVTFGVLFPLWFAAMAENTALSAQGLPSIHINTIQTLAAFVVIGGTGATLPLCFFMLRSKSQMMKTLGRTALVPSLLNINEPLIFGLPIVFNPVLVIPFVLNSFVNATLVFLAMNSGLVSKPVNMLMLNFAPGVLISYLYTMDFKATILHIVLIVINGVIWYPFFKAYEKVKVQEEQSNT